MADSAIAITAGAGTSVDTRTEGTNGNHRQVIVLGDPATNAGVAPVDATAGLKVDLGADNDITGTVTANLSATDNAVLDQIELNTDPLLVVGGGTEATAIRVTIANDSTGVVSIDDNGGAITVDGSLTVDLGANNDVTVTNATAANCKVEATIAAAQSIGAVCTNAGTFAVQAVCTNAGTFAVQADLGANNDVTVTNATAANLNCTAELGATDNAVLDSIVTNTNRVAITGYGQAKLDNADVTTAQVLIAAVADKKFYITSLILSVAAAGSYWIEDDDAAQITCKYTLAANGGVSASFPIDTPYKSTTVNKGLKVKGSAAGVIGCMITYYVLA